MLTRQYWTFRYWNQYFGPFVGVHHGPPWVADVEAISIMSWPVKADATAQAEVFEVPSSRGLVALTSPSLDWQLEIAAHHSSAGVDLVSCGQASLTQIDSVRGTVVQEPTSGATVGLSSIGSAKVQ